MKRGARTLMPNQVFVEVVSGVEGPSLSVGGVDHGNRVAGPKPWGGGSTIHSFKVDADNLRRVLNDYVPDTLRAQNAELIKALTDMLGRFNALRKAVHDGSTNATRENVEYLFGGYLDRAGIHANNQQAIAFASIALAKVQKEII